MVSMSQALDTASTSAPQSAAVVGRILVADDEADMLSMMRDVLEEEGHSVTAVPCGDDAIARIRESEYDLLLCDVMMPHGSGVDVLEWIKRQEKDLPVIMITGNATVESAIAAMKLGAWEYIQKPFDTTELLVLVRNALENSRLRRQNAMFRRQIANQYNFAAIIGDSKPLREVIERVKAVADVSASVLLNGESGSGKSLFARAIHYNGPRRNMPLVSVSLDAIPPESMESELFGHVKGAFPGAETDRRGLFQEADQSTIYLNEVASLPLHLQPKVVAAMQDGIIVPMGARQPRQVNVRVIAATNRDLEGEVLQGNFREDLYYSLKIVSVNVPSLRDRREDVIPLALHFLQQAAATHGRPARDISESGRKALLRYRWPGNVRELSNTMQQAVILSRKEVLGEEDLRLPDGGGLVSGMEHYRIVIPESDLTLREIIADVTEQVEQAKIRDAMDRTDGNRTKAAAMLGVSLRTLLYKLKDRGEYDVDTGSTPAAPAAPSRKAK